MNNAWNGVQCTFRSELNKTGFVFNYYFCGKCSFCLKTIDLISPFRWFRIPLKNALKSYHNHAIVWLSNASGIIGSKVWEWVVSSNYRNGSFREQWNIEISIKKNTKLAINNKQSAIFQFYERIHAMKESLNEFLVLRLRVYLIKKNWIEMKWKNKHSPASSKSIGCVCKTCSSLTVNKFRSI